MWFRSAPLSMVRPTMFPSRINSSSPINPLYEYLPRSSMSYLSMRVTFSSPHPSSCSLIGELAPRVVLTYCTSVIAVGVFPWEWSPPYSYEFLLSRSLPRPDFLATCPSSASFMATKVSPDSRSTEVHPVIPSVSSSICRSALISSFGRARVSLMVSTILSECRLLARSFPTSFSSVSSTW